MQDLINYFIAETNKKHDEVKRELDLLNEKIDQLNEFKISLITTTRLTSLIVSAICGFVTMAVSVGIQIYLTK